MEVFHSYFLCLDNNKHTSSYLLILLKMTQGQIFKLQNDLNFYLPKSCLRIYISLESKSVTIDITNTSFSIFFINKKKWN